MVAVDAQPLIYVAPLPNLRNLLTDCSTAA